MYKNNTFQLKRYYSLFIYVHSKREQKVIASYQIYSVFRHCYFESNVFRSNVQNVRLQRRHRPTDDASTRRWRAFTADWSSKL